MQTWNEHVGSLPGNAALTNRRPASPVATLGVQLRRTDLAATELAVLLKVLRQNGLRSSVLWSDHSAGSPYRQHATVALFPLRSFRTLVHKNATVRIAKNWILHSTDLQITSLHWRTDNLIPLAEPLLED